MQLKSQHQNCVTIIRYYSLSAGGGGGSGAGVDLGGYEVVGGAETVTPFRPLAGLGGAEAATPSTSCSNLRP